LDAAELALGIVVQSAEVKLTPMDSKFMRFRMAAITQQLQVTPAQLTFALVFLRRIYTTSPATFHGFIYGPAGGPRPSVDECLHRCLVLLFTAVGIGRKCLHDTSRRRISQWRNQVSVALRVPPTLLDSVELEALFALQFRLHVSPSTFDAWIAFLEAKVLQIETARQQIQATLRRQRMAAAAAAAAGGGTGAATAAPSGTAEEGAHQQPALQRPAEPTAPAAQQQEAADATAACAGNGANGDDSVAKRRRFNVSGPLSVDSNHALSLKLLAESLKSPVGMQPSSGVAAVQV